jgi:LytS/YehU family sensor histidine kinase
LAATYYRELRIREVRNSQLEAQLANARLQVLKMQLDPHFLFNTMNSISSLMRHDVEAADAMLIGLSDLLRMSLDNVGKQEIPLRDEMEFLEGYLDIQQIRFRERLTVNVKADPELLDALIPNMITQPLVENAIKHGIAPHSAPGKIEVRVDRQGENVRVHIFNDGQGLPKNGAAFPARGVGLSNTRSRLEVLYGLEHTFHIEALPQGGVLATIIFPYRTATDSVKEVSGDEVTHADSRVDRR